MAPTVTPEPAYIAASAASQIVTSDQDFEDSEWAEAHGQNGVVVTSGAVGSINSFLDQLLYSFIRTARSTQLSALRPAITEILKPRLAGEAIAGADEELKEYLGGSDDDLASMDPEQGSDFDLELTWRLARLRCMVYTRLGDMEEEDEEEYLERMFLDDREARSRSLSKVSPAAAIFLTSILEFIGEHLLAIAGDSARTRSWSRGNAEDTQEHQSDRMTVEESDVEKVALNGTFGRLWRTWRKRPRAAVSRSLSRALSRDSNFHRGNSSAVGSRRSSIGTVDDVAEREITAAAEPSVDEIPEVEKLDDPALIALPMRDNDIDEIEVPGLAPELDDDDDEKTLAGDVPEAKRPLSMFVFPRGQSPNLKEMRHHTRSNSVPAAPRSEFQAPPGECEDEEKPEVFETPLERPDPIDIEAPVEPEESQIPTPRASVVPVDEPLVVAEQVPRPASGLANGAMERAQGHTLNIPRDRDSHDTSSARYSTVDSSDVINEYSRPLSELPEAAANGQHHGSGLTGLGLQEMDPHEASYLHEDSDSDHDLETYEIVSQPVEDRRPDSLLQGAQIARVMTPKDITSFSAIRRPNSTVQTPTSATVAQNPFARTPSQASRTSQHYSPSGSPPKQRYTPPQERAVLHRVPEPVVASSPQKGSLRSRRSGSMNSFIEKRPIHTSGSSSSQVSNRIRGFARRPSHDSERKMEMSTAESSEFDKLIRSEETIQYTLTPESVRGSTDVSVVDEYKDSNFNQLNSTQSTIPRPRRANTSDLADFLKNTAPPGDEGPKNNRYNKPIKLNGLRSHPPERSPSFESPGLSALPRTDSIVKGSTMPTPPRQASFSSTTTRTKNVAPRDARIENSPALRDLADFARSSGPDQSGQLPRALTTAVPPTARKPSYEASNRKPSIGSPQIPGSRFAPTAASRPSTDSRKYTGPRLEARAAVTPGGEQTSDLIDFIREGPPRDPMEGHRIPRSVAPFRSTMDSDQLTALGGRGEEKDDRTVVTHTSLGSFQDSVAKSSVNSRTGLLDSSNHVNGRKASNGNMSSYSNGNGTTTTKINPSRVRDPYAIDDDDDFKPQRKQRRVKDPYAIDDSDDDLEELMQTTAKPKPQRQEESLMDFLRNTTPPGDNTPQPLAINTQAMNHKPSSQSMKSRFLRSSSISKKSTPAPRPSTSNTSRSNFSTSQNRLPPIPSTYQPLPAPQLDSRRPSYPSSPRYDSTSLNPSHAGPRPNTGHSNGVNGSSGQLRSVSSTTSASAAYRKQVKFEPREVDGPRVRTGTSDLADFFRDGPPPGIMNDVQAKPLGIVDDGEKRGFAKMFSRRRRD